MDKGWRSVIGRKGVAHMMNVVRKRGPFYRQWTWKTTCGLSISNMSTAGAPPWGRRCKRCDQ